MPPLPKLLDHLEWADARMLEALRKTPNERALHVFAHIVGAEHVWISRMRGEAARFEVWPKLSVDECAELAAENAAALRDFTDLERVVNYRNTAGKEFNTSVEDVLTHVAMHGQYHRGQVNLLLRQAGSEPVPVDYVVWTRR